MPKALAKSQKTGGSSHCGDAAQSLDDNDASVDDRTASTTGRGGLYASPTKNQRSVVSQLSHDTVSTLSAGNRLLKESGSIFCFNDVTDVVEMLTRQNLLLVRLEREQRLKQSGLSLLATDKGDEGSTSVTVSGVAQRMIQDAHKSLASFATLQRVLATEATDASVGRGSTSDRTASDSWVSCLEMPYRHITSLSTRTNLIHMKIGDQGIMRISQVLPGNTLITDIVLASARITSAGLKYLCDAMLFLPNLKYLDLSQNCIDDVGAVSLSEVLGNSETMIGECSSVEQITLMGNRITLAGAQALLDVLASSKVSYLKYVSCSTHPHHMLTQ